MDTVKSTIEKKNNDRQVSEEDQSGDGDDMEVTTPSQSAHIDEKEQQASSDGDDVEVTAPAQSTHIDEKEQQQPFPDRIEGFGYRWNERGQLRSVTDDEPFKYDVYDGDRTKNQQRYEALGEAINEEVYRMLENEGLHRIAVPVDNVDGGGGFFFASDDLNTNRDTLMVLVHGSGVVRAGQWARRLIINKDLDVGTQLPYIRECKSRNWSIVVLNTNLNTFINNDGKLQRITGNDSPSAHGVYVWGHFIESAPCQRIVIVAHSAGGFVTETMAQQYPNDFINRVKVICLTDSSFSGCHIGKPNYWLHLLRITRNWVTSGRPIDAVEKRRNGVCCVSAGTQVHEETSSMSMRSVFAFIDSQLNDGEPSGGGGDNGNATVPVDESSR